jgi:parallel beta-helix repeat protein
MLRIRSPWAKKSTAPRRATARLASRPRLEVMEDRWVPATLFVDDDRRQIKNAQFTSIQAAVAAAAPGDTIRVAEGVYREQVTIPADKDGLTLEAFRKHQQPVVQGVGEANGDAVIRVQGAEGVTIRGFKITGVGTADYGIQVDQGGSATILDNTITGIRRNPFDGVQTGFGILVGGLDSAANTGTATIIGNTITDYQKGGIVVTNEGSRATILDNTITGRGPTDVIAQNGIQVSLGADAVIANNTIARNSYTGDETFATGVLVFQAGDVTITGNRLIRNDEGVAVRGTDDVVILDNDVTASVLSGIDLQQVEGGTVAGNRVSGSGLNGIELFDAVDVTVTNNFVRGSGQDGLFVGGASSGNQIIRNDIRGSRGFDIYDETTGAGTAGTANTYTGNTFRTSNVPALAPDRQDDHGKPKPPGHGPKHGHQIGRGHQEHGHGLGRGHGHHHHD